jgi:hypothetical protein
MNTHWPRNQLSALFGGPQASISLVSKSQIHVPSE